MRRGLRRHSSFRRPFDRPRKRKITLENERKSPATAKTKMALALIFETSSWST